MLCKLPFVTTETEWSIDLVCKACSLNMFSVRISVGGREDTLYQSKWIVGINLIAAGLR